MLPEGTIIFNRFELKKRIGHGRFGDVYLSSYPQSFHMVAVKVEHLGERLQRLEAEFKVYKILKGGVGIPNIHHYGISQDHRCLVMDLLGRSIADLFRLCGRRFSLKTVLALAAQMIDRIEYLHSKGFVHRDISPTNFLLGKFAVNDKNPNRVFMIDFNLVKKYRRHGVHIPYRDDRRMIGEPRYASINNHLGIEYSRRDDLESLGYVVMYFLRGSLPWQGLTGENVQQRIFATKQATPIETLCEGFPSVFVDYFNYCRGLQFDETPDYDHIRQMFSTIYPESYRNFEFDWIPHFR